MYPTTPDEFLDAVRGSSHALIVGAGTKPRPAHVGPGFTQITTLALRGIVEYEPDEFTITALAGTTIREIEETLAARGQYLRLRGVIDIERVIPGRCRARGARGKDRRIQIATRARGAQCVA